MVDKVWVYDLAPAADVESELYKRLVAMGWTPPTKVVQPAPDVVALQANLRRLLADKERAVIERCAQVCDTEADEWGSYSYGSCAARNCAEAIRDLLPQEGKHK